MLRGDKMLETFEINRQEILRYARKWAFSRNPAYYDFEDIGGDCTNFASQCIFAGCGVMNYEQTFGWYYKSAADRTPSWTGVPYLYDFLVSNKNEGPFGEETDVSRIEAGDIVQLKISSDIYQHTPVITDISGVPILENIYVSAHTYDAYNRPLLSYSYKEVRFIHILGFRKWV